MWQKKKPKIFIGIILVIVIVGLGFYRDFIFININYIIEQLYYNKEVGHYHSMYEYLIPLDVSGLMTLKWVLTLTFTLINLLLSVLIIKALLISFSKPLNLLYLGYLMIFILSGATYIVGKLIGQQDLGYTLSRRFMGTLQSPVPLMVVTAAHMLFYREGKNLVMDNG